MKPPAAHRSAVAAANGGGTIGNSATAAVRRYPLPKSSAAASMAAATIKTQEGGALDLVFVVDETASMGGEIAIVQQKMIEMLQTIANLPTCSVLRYGLIGFRDHSDPWTSQVRVPFTQNVNDMMAGVKKMAAEGGGDYPEAVTDGLFSLLRLDWTPGAARCAVLIGDAPPHGVGGHSDSYPDGCPCGESWKTQIESMRETGIVLHTVGCTNLHEPEIFQWMSKHTGGQFFPLRECKKLPGIITGVASRELDMIRVERQVLSTIREMSSLLSKIQKEEDRASALFTELILRNVQLRFVNEKDAALLESRDITLDDLGMVLQRLRHRNAWHATEPLKAEKSLFPSWTGVASPATLSGLFATLSLKDGKEQQRIPLTGVQVSVQIQHGATCCVTVVQSYVNSSQDNAMDTVYRFPVDSTAAVTGFTAVIDRQRVIHAKCMEKKAARQVHREAVARGDGAFLLEQKQDSIFEMKIGNVLPGQTIAIRLSYIQLLEQHPHSQLPLSTVSRFSLPTTVAPRYAPPRSKNDLQIIGT
jgi:Mg-chelatase subunit ChlD